MRKNAIRTMAAVLAICLLACTTAFAEPKWASLYRGAVKDVFRDTSKNYYVGLADIRGKGLPILMLGNRSGSHYYVNLYYVTTGGSLRKSTHNRINVGYGSDTDIAVFRLHKSNGKYETVVLCQTQTSNGKYDVRKLLRVTQNSKRVLDIQELFKVQVLTGTSSSGAKYYVSKKKVSSSTYNKKYTAYLNKFSYESEDLYMQQVYSQSDALSRYESDLRAFL